MSTQSRRSPAPGFTGLSLPLALVLVLAASVTGLLLSILFNGIGLPFLLCFFVSVIFVTLFVEPESLFMTVAPLPLFFAVFAFFTSWGSNIANAPDGTNWASRTMVWTSVYPVVEFFPALALITFMAIGIAILRVVMLRGRVRVHDRNRRQQRSHNRAANRRNLRSTTRAREQSNRVTVEELMARNRADGATRSPVRSSRLPRTHADYTQPAGTTNGRGQSPQQPQYRHDEFRQRPAEPTRTARRRAAADRASADAARYSQQNRRN